MCDPCRATARLAWGRVPTARCRAYCLRQYGEGIVQKGVENTICNIGRLDHDGMRETDEEIIKIMLCNQT